MKLSLACQKLARNQDFDLVLTHLKEECIAVFTDIDATESQIMEAHRRYVVVDGLRHRIKTNG